VNPPFKQTFKEIERNRPECLSSHNWQFQTSSKTGMTVLQKLVVRLFMLTHKEQTIFRTLGA